MGFNCENRECPCTTDTGSCDYAIAFKPHSIECCFKCCKCGHKVNQRTEKEAVRYG